MPKRKALQDTNLQEIKKRKFTKYFANPNNLTLTNSPLFKNNVTEAFVVEAFLGYRISNNDFQYLIKWEGYSDDDNSYERENRIVFYADILDFWLGHMSTGKLTSREIIGMKGAFLNHSLQSSFGRFMLNQNAATREKIIKNNKQWEYRYLPWNLNVNLVAQAHYSHQLRLLHGLFPDFPFFEVYNEFDSAMPLPLSKYAFDDFLSPGEAPFEAHETDPYLIKNECIETFEKDLPLPVNNRDTYSNNLIKNAKLGIFFQNSQAFLSRKQPVHMVVIRREERRWDIITRGPLSPDTQLMGISGKIVRKTVAAQALIEYGELLAYPFFVELDDGHCLDRREFSDFSQYLSQSCDPNCFVKREYEKGKARLFVYSKKNIAQGDRLTVDWFAMFADESKKYKDQDDLVDTRIDHILCLCANKKCRKVIWQQKLNAQQRKLANKNFEGLVLV